MFAAVRCLQLQLCFSSLPLLQLANLLMNTSYLLFVSCAEVHSQLTVQPSVYSMKLSLNVLHTAANTGVQRIPHTVYSTSVLTTCVH